MNAPKKPPTASGTSTSTATKAVTARTVERRSGKDRRAGDVPPPNGRERRRTAEPRKPEVTEIEMTVSQWGRLPKP